MTSLAHHLATMAYNNAWANHRLLGACCQLSQPDFTARRTSFFPSLAATLNHNLTVDWFYVDAIERALQGRPVNTAPACFFTPEQPFPDCHQLRDAQRDVDRRLVEACVGLSDAQLELAVPIQRTAGVETEVMTRLLAHLFQHQIHHRGQAHAMLAGTTVAPPQLDEFFCASEAHLRAAELAALGYSEAVIWSAVPCGCFEPDWQKHPAHDRRELPGLDERDGLFADVAVETCRTCARTWVQYHFEYEAVPRSGRWYRGLVPASVAAGLAVTDARAVLEGLPWYWAGGSYFDGQVTRRSGKLAT